MRYALIILVLFTASCSGNIRQLTGIKREGPDEFRVRTYEPLTVPEQFEVRAPDLLIKEQERNKKLAASTPFFLRSAQKQPALSLVEENSNILAESSDSIAEASFSSGETKFLEKVGSAKVATIRSIVDHEYEQQKESTKSILDTVIYWRDEQKSDTVDIVEELERLKEQNINSNSRNNVNRAPET